MHPFTNIFKELWPVLSKLYDKLKSNEEVVEALCKVVKLSMRCLI